MNFSLYYETLCPYCRQFFTEQLAKAYQTIPDIINITIVPYGNAHETYDSSSQMYQFTCQHGSDECVGNLIHVRQLEKNQLIQSSEFSFLELCTFLLSND